ncbi:hypothetical protein HN789_03605 [archaeon]|jgi:hypothetical protein|nr:hypothetical protein [archaeon]MBT4023047.1 hypothetical protein [archaeon]MBT4272446.1 hypothetical protein [archaeon]MBT4460544.1 hypothetical protein [archaeon]MBT4857866.1 hypothetical protein [archaeon]
MGDKALKFNIKPEYIPLIFLIIATIAAININKIPLTHPGNIKAADPFYHAIAVESIKDTEQWNYLPYYISLGQEKAANLVPPLFYFNAAILSLFSSLPAWVTLYLMICIAQGLSIILSYLITKEVFNEKAAIIASSLSVIPLSASVWLYPLYIGLWPQLSGYLFIQLFMWLFIRYFKKRELWSLIFLGICISSLLLLHSMDLGLLLIPCIFIGIDILKRSYVKKKFKLKQLFKESIAFAGIPAFMLLILLPRILFVWSSVGGKQYKFGFFGFRELFQRSYLGGLPHPDFFLLPTVLVIIFTIGVLQQLINFKKYKLLIFSQIYYFAIIYLLPPFVQDPFYLSGRTRALQYFMILPTIGYILYFGLSKLKSKKIENFAILGIFLLAISFALPSYNNLVDRMQGEHIPIHEWEAYQWIHANTPKESKVLFFGSVFQTEFIYTKRITAILNMQQYQDTINKVATTNITPTIFEGSWGGNTLRWGNKYEVTPFKYETYEEPNSTIHLTDFDYVVFQDITPQIAQINRFFIYQFINNHNFSGAYEKNGYLIIKRN